MCVTEPLIRFAYRLTEVMVTRIKKTFPCLVQIPVHINNPHPETQKSQMRELSFAFKLSAQTHKAGYRGRGTVTAGSSDFRNKQKRETPGQVKLEKELGTKGVDI